MKKDPPLDGVWALYLVVKRVLRVVNYVVLMKSRSSFWGNACKLKNIAQKRGARYNIKKADF